MSSSLTPHASSVRAGGLQHLLGTFDVSTFLQTYMCEQMLHVSGGPARWSNLFSWRELNAVLNGGFVSVPRVRLVAKGRDVEASLYSDERGQRQWPDSRRCQELMAQGATLILMNLESINPRIEAFVRELERDLGADVRVDLVATCASVPGLNMHWDNAECFNVQLDGEKRWSVVRPDRRYPLTATSRFPARSDAVKPTAPEVSPTWEGTLVPGDLIYLPRGWWHAVTPHVTPSLHLSFAVDVPTLHDFLQWFAQDAVQQESVRRALPVWQTAADRRSRFIEDLTSLTKRLSPEAVERYLTHLTSAAAARPHFALPSAGTPGAARLDSHTRVRLRSSRRLHWRLDGELVMFDWHGQPYQFDAHVVPALQKLDTMETFTIEELSEGTNRLLIHACVLTLLTAGVLSLTERVRESED